MPLVRSELDLTRPESITAVLDTHQPDIVVNCAAYNFVDRAESEPEAAFAVNAFGVRNLAIACAKASIRLVHFSTDYVFGFDLARQSPYSESDAPGPVSVYGQSKLAGEGFVLAASSRNAVIRTCGLYGAWGTGGKGGNFVETMLHLAREGKPLRVVADQHCTPSSTVDVAATSAALIERSAAGLFHVVNAGSCSWYEFAASIFRLAGITANLTPIPTAEYPTPARRPGFSVLAMNRLSSLAVPTPRAWPEALAAYLEERRSRT